MVIHQTVRGEHDFDSRNEDPISFPSPPPKKKLFYRVLGSKKEGAHLNSGSLVSQVILSKLTGL